MTDCLRVQSRQRSWRIEVFISASEVSSGGGLTNTTCVRLRHSDATVDTCDAAAVAQPGVDLMLAGVVMASRCVVSEVDCHVLFEAFRPPVNRCSS